MGARGIGPAIASPPTSRTRPELLEALGDPDAGVRAAARRALDAIRSCRHEKAQWDCVFAGEAGLSATAGPLEQAKPGNDAATRVPAIRSLGVLAAPETRPFLITWNTDADEAARSATRSRNRVSTEPGQDQRP